MQPRAQARRSNQAMALRLGGQVGQDVTDDREIEMLLDLAF
jgi:hypothetical protein